MCVCLCVRVQAYKAYTHKRTLNVIKLHDDDDGLVTRQNEIIIYICIGIITIFGFWGLDVRVRRARRFERGEYARIELIGFEFFYAYGFTLLLPSLSAAAAAEAGELLPSSGFVNF